MHDNSFPSSDMDQEVDEAFKHIMTRVLEFTAKEGNNFVIDFVIKLDLNMATYQPIAGSTYLPLTEQLASKQAIVYIQNGMISLLYTPLRPPTTTHMISTLPNNPQVWSHADADRL